MSTRAYDAPGPYPVGCTSMTTKGPEGLSLPTEVWFPAEPTLGESYSYLPGIRGRATADAAPDRSRAHPVIVFSHGHTGIRFQSITLAEQLASHGFVVAAPDHVGNTFVDTVVDQLGFVAMRRPLDLGCVFDALVAHDTLGACLDPAAGYAAVGHSFGGWTALLAAGARVDRNHLSEHRHWDHFLLSLLEQGETRFLDRHDPRVWAVVSMAPTGYPTFGPEGLADLAVPVLLMGGTEDDITPWELHQRPIFDALRGAGRCAARFHGASHYTFCDAGRLVPIDPYTRGSLHIDVAHPIIAALTAAFLERALGIDDGRADPWLPPDHPHVEWHAA